MKNSRERQILAGVLLLAGLALTVDRVILGSDVTGPAESEAGVLDAPVDPLSLLITPKPQTLPVQADDVPTLADRLRMATEGTPGGGTAERDAFSVSPAWTPQDVQEDASASDSIQQIEAFINSHRLDAVLVTGDRHCAVVDGQTIYLGQTLDGYRLVAVNERSARFEQAGRVATLVIQAGGPAS